MTVGPGASVGTTDGSGVLGGVLVGAVVGVGALVVVGLGVFVVVGLGVLVVVGVGALVVVGLGVLVVVGLGVLVVVGLTVGVAVIVGPGVAVGVTKGVCVGLAVGVTVNVGFGVSVTVTVGSGVGVLVGTGVCVDTGSSVGAGVGVVVPDMVGIAVGVTVVPAFPNTDTKHMKYVPGSSAYTRHSPGDIPRTMPFASTVATLSFVDHHLGTRFVSKIFNCFCFPTLREMRSSLSVGVKTFFFAFTVTRQISLLLPTFAVIFAVPLPLALTTPWLLTVATFFLFVDHLIFFVAPVTFSLTFLPFISVVFVLLSFGLAALTGSARGMAKVTDSRNASNSMATPRFRLFIRKILPYHSIKIVPYNEDLVI